MLVSFFPVSVQYTYEKSNNCRPYPIFGVIRTAYNLAITYTTSDKVLEEAHLYVFQISLSYFEQCNLFQVYHQMKHM